MAAILKPIYEIQSSWKPQHEVEMVEYRHLKEEAELRHKDWQRTYTLALRTKGTKKAIPFPPRPDDISVARPCCRLLVNDATYEKLHVILSENPGGVLMLRTRGALEMLIVANWIRPFDAGKSSTGGRPSEIYLINPRLKEMRPCQAKWLTWTPNSANSANLEPSKPASVPTDPIFDGFDGGV